MTRYMLMSGNVLVRVDLPSADAARSAAAELHLTDIRIYGYAPSGAIVEVVP